ncbi:uncharacterized protein LOC122531299 isoform X2 [Frieseomelitta varia]|uniref:uncharacterized protein LOC122531299 isoform X2 n=1 Tax=Frieseomelitta varia TaxID=561572 RepID=UPI001CB6A9A6|nr:uncharacterized protein LOC122531299 isoform X2 [Frieseomelitta varia]
MNTNELGFFLLLVGLALTQAVPTKLTDEVSLNEGQEEPKVDETEGEDQVRPKKSTICLESGSLVPQVQSGGIQTVSQPVQTLNIQPVPQQIQMSVIQPSQACMKLIQPPVQPTVKVIQPPQVYLPSQTNVNIIQPPREAAKPVVETVIKEKIVKNDPKPEKIVLPKEEPLFPKPVMVVAEPEPVAYVKVPQCNQCQQSVMQCSCTKQRIPALSSVVLMEPAASILEYKRRNSQAAPLLNHHAHHHHHHL